MIRDAKGVAHGARSGAGAIMQAVNGIVYVVDDDSRFREALEDLLASFALQVVSFASAMEYVASPKVDAPSCLLLDVELPDVNGLELQRQLAAEEHPPIVFMTGYGDIPSSVRAMKAGAVDFLAKPFSKDDLLSAIDSALQRDREARKGRTELAALRTRHATLTPREREVLALVVSGLLNKQSAAQLGISEVTMQIHRGQVMRKMAAQSLADLVRMAVKLGITTHTSVGVNAPASPAARSAGGSVDADLHRSAAGAAQPRAGS
jgi:FixJ family two-component response regulator